MNKYFVVGLQTQTTQTTGQKAIGYRVTMVTIATKDKIPLCTPDSIVCKNFLVSEADLIGLIQREGNVVDNATVCGGRIQGAPASFDRFKLAVDKNNPNNVRRPLVLIGKIVNMAGDTIGYKALDYGGVVRDLDMKAVRAWINQAQSFMVGSKPMPPFQNVIVHGKDSSGDPVIVPYKGNTIMEFCTDFGETRRALAINHTKKPMTTRDKKTVDKTVATFKPECKKLIAQAQASGLNVRPLMDARFSEVQLKCLIKLMRKKVDVQKFANPDITPAYMDFCGWIERLGVDCSFVVNENLNNGQKSEVILGIIDGVDVTKYAKKHINSREMAQLRGRMRDAFWSKNSFRVTTDDTLVAFAESFD